MANIYAAGTLCMLTEKEVWALPEGPMVVEFADGSTLETGKRRTVLSWYFWRMHREFPGCPILPSHHVGNKSLTKGFDQKLGAKIFWDVYEGYPDKRENLVWEMSKVSYEIFNTIHNVTVSRLAGYVTTVDLEDVIELMDDPVIREVKDKIEADEMEFKEGYERIMQELKKDKPTLRNNGVAKMTRANLLSEKQLVQFIGARGNTFATDGSIFMYPIKKSYADGFDTLYDSITESRSASRALLMNDDPLKDSEYLNRRMQLLAAVVRSVVGDDCGTPHTIPWLVSEQDMHGLKGKYHMVDGRPVLFDPKDTSLIGQVINVRSITMCQNDDTGTVCKTCLGQISRIVPPRTNVGHFLTTDPLSSLSQLILSTKHVETSQGALYFSLEGEAGKWFRYDPDNRSAVTLKRQNVANTFLIRFAEEEAPGLNSVLQSGDPTGLLPQRVSCITELKIANADGHGQRKGDWCVFNLRIGDEGSALSSDVLECIARNGWKTVNGVVEVRLDGFKGRPVFITPRRSESMLTFQRRIKHFVFGSEEKDEAIVSHKHPGQAVAAMKRLFDEKIKVNLAHAEIFVRACMTVNAYANDYRLPRGGDPFVFMSARRIISNRSVSAALAFEGQKRVILNHKSYLTHERPVHPLDPIIGADAPYVDNR
jgi:hypothetical protein